MRAEPPGRLVSRALDWELSAADVLRLVRADPHPVALLGSWAGGSDIVASDPVRVCCRARPGRATCSTRHGEPGSAAMQSASRALRRPARFGGGWIGYLGFGPAGRSCRCRRRRAGRAVFPPTGSASTTTCSRRDRATGRWAFEALCTPGARGRAGAPVRGAVAPPGTRPAAGPREYSLRQLPADPVRRRSTARRSGQTISYIRSGDIFQANICLRLEADVRRGPAGRVLRRGHPARPAVRRVHADAGRRAWRACHPSCSCAAPGRA